MALSQENVSTLVAAIEAIQSGLDDFAAVADEEGAEQLGKLLGTLQISCEFRATAIDCRLRGNIETAVSYEGSSERLITEALAVFGG